MISASWTKRTRLSGSSACRIWICLTATSRCNSSSWATNTSPRPPRACGRTMRNREPLDVLASAPSEAGIVPGRIGGLAITASAAGRHPRARLGSATVAAGIADPLQIVFDRVDRVDGREAFFRIVVVQLEMLADRALPRASAARPLSTPCSPRICPSGLSFASTQAFIAATSCSRLMKSICSARMPNNRLRSSLDFCHVVCRDSVVGCPLLIVRCLVANDRPAGSSPLPLPLPPPHFPGNSQATLNSTSGSMRQAGGSREENVWSGRRRGDRPGGGRAWRPPRENPGSRIAPRLPLVFLARSACQSAVGVGRQFVEFDRLGDVHDAALCTKRRVKNSPPSRAERRGRDDHAGFQILRRPLHAAGHIHRRAQAGRI